ncbi:hypothetical protein [Moraxella oculi]|uniref:Uncharacterized protein n=1 Tax=Moraxella oculi TaxID=2940516 RepID=A0ABW8U5C9_9GAMM
MSKKENMMRELNTNEIKAVSGARRWSMEGMGGNRQGYTYGSFKFGNFGNQGVNIVVHADVACGNGRTHWGDRGTMVGVYEKMVSCISKSILLLTLLVMLGCSTTHTKLDNMDTKNYPTYNPNCSRFVQHIPMPQKLNSVENHERSSIATECKSSH